MITGGRTLADRHARGNTAGRRRVRLARRTMFARPLQRLNLQRVLGDPTFGLPYWDWSLDGTPAPGAAAAAPEDSNIWKERWMGGEGNPVDSGPFAFQRGFRVRVESGLASRK